MYSSESGGFFPTVWMAFQAVARGQRGLRTVSAVLVVGALLAPRAQATNGEWQAVERLSPGSRIAVKGQHNYRCVLEGATDDKIICEINEARSWRTVTVTIPREEIDEVWVFPHPDQGKDAKIGAAVGAGAGAAAGAAANTTYRGFHSFVGGLGGAAAGAFVGAVVPIFQTAFRHSKVIYKRSEPRGSSTS